MLPLDQLLRQRAGESPADPAIRFLREPYAGISITWGTLDQEADNVANELAHLDGFADQVPLAVVMDDRPDMLGIIYGVMRAGAALVPIDPLWGVGTIQAVLEHSKPLALVTPRPVQWAYRSVRTMVLFDELTRCRSTPTRAPPSIPNRVALIAFTSGTTSSPKGVLLRHSNLRHAYALGAAQLNLVRKDTFGCAFRLSGLGILGIHYFLGLETGSTTVVLPELNVGTAKHYANLLEQNVSFIYFVPSLIHLLNKLAEPTLRSNAGAVSSSMLCVSGGAPLSSEAMATFQRKFGYTLRNIYGLTEASFAFFFGARDTSCCDLSTVGKPIGFQAKLVSPDNTEILGPGTGELWMTGPMVSEGYLNNATATSMAFQDGWLRTGDIVERDASGYHYIRGRIKDIIIRGGITVYPEEIEEVLNKNENVLESCAVGIPDDICGEEIFAMAFLRRERRMLERELLEFARRQLGAHRSPRRIYCSGSPIPRNGSGKMIRAEVQQIIRAKFVEAT